MGRRVFRIDFFFETAERGLVVVGVVTDCKMTVWKSYLIWRANNNGNIIMR